jgi:hypothetical protein
MDYHIKNIVFINTSQYLISTIHIKICYTEKNGIENLSINDVINSKLFSE